MRDFTEDDLCPVCQRMRLVKQVEDVVLPYEGTEVTLKDMVSHECVVCEEGFYIKTDQERLYDTAAELRRQHAQQNSG